MQKTKESIDCYISLFKLRLNTKNCVGCICCIPVCLMTLSVFLLVWECVTAVDLSHLALFFYLNLENWLTLASLQGTPQHISVLFDEPTTITAFGIQFQGGFVGKDCLVVLEDSTGKKLQSEPFYPDDINAKQTFTLTKPVGNAVKLRVNFKGSTDFFGRIIVYNFEVY